MNHTVFLFGEAEKGDFCTPYLCQSLPQLVDIFGNPPPESQGILYGVQTLLFDRQLIYYRVKEEGFSLTDYKRGIRLLEKRELFYQLTAICLPGVGNTELIEEISSICSLYRSILITSEKDFYDFMTS